MEEEHTKPATGPEIAAYVGRELRVGVRSTTEQLARRFSRKQRTMNNILWRHLTPEDKRLRQKLRYQDNLDHKAVGAYVQQEILNYPDTEVMTPTNVLADHLNVSPQTICDAIRDWVPEPLRQMRTLVLQQQNATSNFNNITPEDHSERSKRAYKKGIGTQNPEERSEAGRKGILTIRYRQPSVNGTRYQSASEAACALSLMQYIPGYEVERGATYQVDVGGYSIDFLLNNLFWGERMFLEWHPIKLARPDQAGDFFEETDFNRYQDELAAASVSKAVDERWSQRLEEEYRAVRQAIVDDDEEYAGTEVLVATTPETLYSRVLQPYGDKLPPPSVFSGLFRKWHQSIADGEKNIKLIDYNNVS